jgi:LPXTG-motif cell wall-anchored protein
LPVGTSGAAYSATLDASLVAATDAPGFAWSEVAPTALGDLVTWSLAADSGPLPDGLSLDPTGSLSGTPTGIGSTEVTLSASVLDDAGDTRARSVVDLTIEVSQAAPTTTEAPTTTTEATTTTAAAGGGGSGTLPATGTSSVAPLVTAGLLLVGSGGAAAVLARRRRS